MVKELHNLCQKPLIIIVMTNDILKLQDRREQFIKDLAVKEAMLAQKEAESAQLKKTFRK